MDATGVFMDEVAGLSAALNAKANPANVQEFSSSGTWIKPATGTFAIIEIVGGGTGGGSGSKYGSGVNHSGGSGGAGGSYCYRIMPLSVLAATEPVTIGAGGLGGAAITTDDTPGIAGGMGQSSFFGTHLCGPGASTAAGGGLLNANAAVSNALINWAPAGTQGMFSGGSGGQGFSANFGGTPPSTCYGAAGGGGGSGVGTTAQNRSGGHGGSSSVFNSLAFNAQNNTFGYRGQSSPSIHGWDSTILPGGMAGGGGGGGSVLELIATPVAGNGGNGVNGGGGGGGGAGVNGSFNSGAGGNGGNGFCRVIVF